MTKSWVPRRIGSTKHRHKVAAIGAVAVHEDDDVAFGRIRRRRAGGAGAAIAAALRLDDAPTRGPRYRWRAVVAAAVDDHDLAGERSRDLRDHGADRLRFVERRNDHATAPATASVPLRGSTSARNSGTAWAAHRW